MREPEEDADAVIAGDAFEELQVHLEIVTVDSCLRKKAFWRRWFPRSFIGSANYGFGVFFAGSPGFLP